MEPGKRSKRRLQGFHKHLHHGLLNRCNYVLASTIAQYAIPPSQLEDAIASVDDESLESRIRANELVKWAVPLTIAKHAYNITDLEKANILRSVCIKIGADAGQWVADQLRLSAENPLLITTSVMNFFRDCPLMSKRRALLVKCVQQYEPPRPPGIDRSEAVMMNILAALLGGPLGALY